jgi:hypothetical protein
LAVFALFCFGFFGVLAFLSTTQSPPALERRLPPAILSRSASATRTALRDGRHPLLELGIVELPSASVCARDTDVTNLRNHLAPDALELLGLVAVHQVDVELRDAGVGEHLQLLDDLVDLAQDAEPIRHLVADEPGVLGTDLAVMQIVIAGPVADVPGEALG